MGLCKCPKRKVTNQFCFEHRVNVCEHCMVQNHPKCVVQSYLQWLQDSDYNPNCEFCHRDLGDDPCVRLMCFHVFHWHCLDKYARDMPSDTAPAGYTCPKCQDCLFPPSNALSPVADALKALLKDVNWARAGLGMPLLEGERRPAASTSPVGPRPNPEGENDTTTNVGVHQTSAMSTSNFDTSSSVMMTPRGKPATSNSLVDYDSLTSSPLLRDPDNDDNKYKRKSALEMFSRWWRTLMGPAARRRQSKMQRYLMIGILVFLAFVTFVALMSYLSRSSDYADPMLEPLNNPNIRIGVDS